MDPFSAFAAAGNVLQFVQFGIGLVHKSVSYIQDGGDLEHQALQGMLQQLLVSNDHLRQSLETESDLKHTPGPVELSWKPTSNA
jgi:hypothetical protein